MTVSKIAACAVAALTIVVLVVLWHTPDSDSAANISPIDVEMASWVGGEREWNGLPRLPVDGDLTAQAQLQAGRMAQCGCLYHSPRGELYWWLNRGWQEDAENVGVTNGAGIEALFGLHLAFILSPPHRDNMLNPAHDALGLAVRQGVDGKFYVAQFYGGT